MPDTLWGAPGDLDTRFGTGGQLEIDIAPMAGEGAYAIARSPSGKLIAGGNAVFVSPVIHRRFALIQLLEDGVVNPTFGTNGIVTTELPGSNGDIHAVAVQPDEKIVVAGSSSLIGGGYGAGALVVARYAADGTLDPMFGTGGLITSNPSMNSAHALIIQPDRKIVVAGDSRICCKVSLARYLVNGTPDTTFGTAGVASVPVPGKWFTSIHALVRQADDKLVVAGTAGNPGTAGNDGDFALVRFDTDGKLDTTFGTGGIVTTDLAGGVDEGYALELQSDGMLLVAGVTEKGGDSDFALARYETNGTLDACFGTNGIVTTDFGGKSDTSRAVLVQGNGIVAVGTASGHFALARYHMAGTPDLSFGNGGIVTTDFTPQRYDQGNAALLLQPLFRVRPRPPLGEPPPPPSDTIVVAGSTSGVSRFGFAAYRGGQSVPGLPCPKPPGLPFKPPCVCPPFPQDPFCWYRCNHWTAVVLANLFYVPAKLGFATVGAVTGGLVYIATLGQSDASGVIWRSSVGGDYLVTPSLVTKGETPRFVGDPGRPSN